MDAASAAFYLLMAVVLKSLRVEREHRNRAAGRGAGAIVTMLVVETSLNVHGALALYPRLSPTAGQLLAPDTQCHQHTLILQRALKNRTLWAERMLDASARGVVGGLWGAHFHLGSFDGCLSAGASSPVGARYCLARLFAADVTSASAERASPPGSHPRRQHPPHYRPCSGASARRWDHVTNLDPESDARDALQGCGLLPGTIPLAEVAVALCVPEACGAAPLEAALRQALTRGPGVAFDVRVQDEDCVAHSELHDRQFTLTELLFWTVVAALSAAALAAPYLGGAVGALSAWDWRVHVAALGRPDPPLSGMDLTALSGIRAINMVLLVGSHRAFNTARLATSNQFIHSTESRTSPLHALGHHAVLLVDTCFFMSGLLMSLSPTVRQGSQHVLRATANRYLRLTPPYALVMLFYAFGMESLGSGPLWKSIVGPEAAACRRWWWANLLYANNYVHGAPGEYACMLQSWSLAVDMQQFVLAAVLLPLLVPAALALRPAGLATALAAALAAALLPPFVATLAAGWPPLLVWTARTLQNPYAEPMFYAMYVPTQFRAAPYVIGVLAGCAMLRFKERGLVLSRWDSWRLTWGCLVAMQVLLASSVLFGDLSSPAAPALVSALYAALCPAAWTAAVALLVLAVTFGHRSAVVGLLRWQPLVTLSRLSYGVYLVHFAVQLLQGGAERTLRHASVVTVFRDGFSDLVLSVLISAWLHFVVEAPVRQLAKTALLRRRPRLDAEPSRKRTASDKTETSPPPPPAASSAFCSAAKASCF